MEILFITIGLLAALAAGFFIGSRMGRSKSETEKVSLLSTIAQKDEYYKTILAEKESANLRLLEEKEAACTSLLNRQEQAAASMLRQKEASHDSIVQELERKNNELAAMAEEHYNRQLEAMRQRFDETVAKMQEQVKNTTAELLKRRQDEFSESSTKTLDGIITPLKETIERMKQSVVDNTQKHDRFSGVFATNVENIIRQSEAARASADKLANALRGNGRVQGVWGETVLTELLESQGLREGVHFDTQAVMRDNKGNALRSDSGYGLRPDVILHLDSHRDVVIDSKVSLSDYLNYINAETDETREMAAAAHVASIERHVKELAAKDYSAYLGSGKTGMGYVIMFVPNTAALLLATTRKPELWRKAMEQNVYIADEQTLYAALKIVSLTWAQIAQAQNHEEVYRLADEMVKRVGMFMEKFVAIGKNLESATKSYEDGLAKLSDKGQSIPNTCRKLYALGVKKQTKKGVPPALLGLDDVENPGVNDAQLPDSTND